MRPSGIGSHDRSSPPSPRFQRDAAPAAVAPCPDRRTRPSRAPARPLDRQRREVRESVVIDQDRRPGPCRRHHRTRDPLSEICIRSITFEEVDSGSPLQLAIQLVAISEITWYQISAESSYRQKGWANGEQCGHVEETCEARSSRDGLQDPWWQAPGCRAQAEAQAAGRASRCTPRARSSASGACNASGDRERRWNALPRYLPGTSRSNDRHCQAR